MNEENNMKFNRLIFSVAYNLLGEKEKAEDVVQDIHLKFLQKPIPQSVSDVRNYVIKTTVNHCINIKNKEDRFSYVGKWLPEPFIAKAATYELNDFEASDLLSYELAYLVEQLNPKERAVFVLREAFDFDHSDIADVLDITAENSRQIYKRTKEKIKKPRTDFDNKSLSIAKRFVSLIKQGKVDDLITIFNDDIVIYGDGGGKAPAISKSICGSRDVAKFLIKLIESNKQPVSYEYVEILNHPAVVISLNGEVICCQVLALNDSKITNIYSVLNPEKLKGFFTI